MCRIFGYGEDAFTLWALKQHMSKILGGFKDKTAISDCIAFYRPSFGRHGKKGIFNFYFNFDGKKVVEKRERPTDYSNYLNRWDLIKKALEE